jgi:ankyrin repeat protein
MAAAGVGRTEGQTMVTEQQAIEAVTVALALKNDINAARADGWTALHGAAYNGADAVVRLLAMNGATLDVVDKLGRTALSIAEGAKVKDTIFVVHKSTADLLRSLGARVGLAETTSAR